LTSLRFDLPFLSQEDKVGSEYQVMLTRKGGQDNMTIRKEKQTGL